MRKSKAIELLGGSVSLAARACGVTSSAVTQWPDELPQRIIDRVHAAQARKHLPPELLGTTDEAAEASAGEVSHAA